MNEVELINFCKSYEERMVGLMRPSIREGSEADKNTYLSGKLISEAGEVHGEVLKYVFHKKDNKEKLLVEIGDVLWYVFNLVNTMNDYWTDHFYSKIHWCANQTSGEILEPSEHMVIGCFEVFSLRSYDQLGGRCAYTLEQIVYNCCKILKYFNYTLEDCLLANIKKLSDRHGETFNAEFYAQKT